MLDWHKFTDQNILEQGTRQGIPAGVLSHHAHAELPEHLIIKEANRALAEGMKARNIRQRLLMWSKNVFGAGLNQDIVLQAANTALRKPSRIQKTTASLLWRNQYHQTEGRVFQQIAYWRCASVRHFRKDCPHEYDEEDNRCRMKDN
jgi:hypothetical protein